MRVLIAEDEAKARRYLALGLREQGFTVDVVEDGAGALTLLHTVRGVGYVLDTHAD